MVIQDSADGRLGIEEYEEENFEVQASGGDIEKTWPTGTRKTARYFHGILSYPDHIMFLTEWCTRSLAGEHERTKKGAKRGEIFQIRSTMRMKYPGWHTNLGTIKAALKSKPEWAAWAQQLVGERKERLQVNREKKQQRKEQREKKEKKGRGMPAT